MTEDTEEEEEELSPQSSSSREKLQAGLQIAGSMVAKLNIGSWINELEQSQGLADDLEERNAELMEEAENKILVASAKAICIEDIQSHLDSFLAKHSGGNSSSSSSSTKTTTTTYEEWIAELHPDNVADDGTVDARFFAPNSDHKMLWYQMMEKKITSKDCPSSSAVAENGIIDNVETTSTSTTTSTTT